MIQKIPLGSAWMVNAAFLFATMSILVKNAATNLHMNEDELAFWRSLLPALVIFGTTLARKKTLKTPFFWGHMQRSLAGTTALLLAFYSLSLC